MGVKLLNFFKPIAGALLILFVLKITGLLGSVSYVTQSALLQTGIRDATSEADEKPKEFDYEFSLATVNGSAIDFNKFKGKVVFLNLWASWCGPCRAEMTGIQSLYESTRSDSVEFVMLSIDKQEHRNKVTEYIQKNKFTFPVYTLRGPLPSLLQVPSIPTTFILSKEGMIVSEEVGATNFNTKRFKNFLQKLAEE